MSPRPPTTIPTKIVGPIKLNTPTHSELLRVPLATLEAPLWLAVNRGARLTRKTAGIKALIVNEGMSRSILLQAPSAQYAYQVVSSLPQHRSTLATIVSQNSNFTHLKEWHTQIVADLIYLRFTFTTGEAAGHNMATKAAELLQTWLLNQYPELKYISLSGNYCVDKKNSAVNGILGRGRYVIAELLLPQEICQEILHTTPEKIVDLNIKKNLLGSILSGGVRTANAHFANMLLALYLATGQDGANIIEGSQGFTYAEMRHTALYFTVTLPNIIMGTVGSGKNLPFVKHNLELLGCTTPTGTNADRLALITAATVLCGELSLLAAQTNPGELMRCHLAVERT